jgi:putative hydrolase of the HAD superfamily
MASAEETHPGGTGRADTSRVAAPGAMSVGEADTRRRIEAVISDFGGVLTTPLADSFQAFQDTSGVPLEELGKAMAAIGARLGVNPLFELETGRLSEVEFLTQIGVQLSEQLGRPVDMDGFGERYFAHLEPNDEMIAYMRALRERGYKLAICTNNVREWEQRWRAMLPVDEIFDVVVDSAFVGARKPEPRIYELTLEALGVEAAAALLIDDIEANCTGARALGIETVWFQSSEQAIADTETALAEVRHA